MEIYWFRAQAPRRVTALTKHLGIDAAFVEVDVRAGGLRAPDYAALNPNMKAPTLVDGDLVLWESAAIMAHLCIKANSDMWPAHDPAEQVEVLRWLSWNDCHWSDAVSPFYFEHVIKTSFGMGPPNRAVLDTSTPGLLKYAKVLDDHLTDRDHIACGRLTIADFQLASMAADWQVAQMKFENFLNIRRWLDALMRVPAWADPWPAPDRSSGTQPAATSV